MGSLLAVIVTAYGDRGAANLPRIKEAIEASTRQPDELWVMTEGIPSWGFDLPTPRSADGTYAVIPYSLKQNYALDRTKADYITYCTDDSWPHPEKYER